MVNRSCDSCADEPEHQQVAGYEGSLARRRLDCRCNVTFSVLRAMDIEVVLCTMDADGAGRGYRPVPLRIR